MITPSNERQSLRAWFDEALAAYERGANVTDPRPYVDSAGNFDAVKYLEVMERENK